MSTLKTLVDIALSDPTVECFVVSNPIWLQLDRDAQDYLVERSGQVTRIQGLNQIAISGVPVAKTRHPELMHRAFVEVHGRSFDGLPIISRII